MRCVVQSVRESVTITYHCATAASALEKIEEFRRADHREIAVMDVGALALSEAQLTAHARVEQGDARRQVAKSAGTHSRLLRLLPA